MADDTPDNPLKRYYSIGETAKLLGETPAVLRSWDREFAHLKTAKNSRGERRFTKDNLEQLRQIKHLLRERGFTVAGARKEIAAGTQDARTTASAPEPAGDGSAGERRAWAERLTTVRSRLAELLQSADEA